MPISSVLTLKSINVLHGRGFHSYSFVFHALGRLFLRLLIDQEVADSPYSIVVTPGDVYGPRSSAYGAGVSAPVATLDNTFYVQV